MPQNIVNISSIRNLISKSIYIPRIPIGFFLGTSASTVVNSFGGIGEEAAAVGWTELGTSLNTDRFGTSVAGGAGIASDGTTINLTGETVTGDAGILYIKEPIAKEVATYKIRTKATLGSVPGTNPMYLSILQKTTEPTVGINTTVGPLFRIAVAATVHATGATDHISINYVEPAGTTRFWNQAGGVWGTSGLEVSSPINVLLNIEYDFILESTETQWRVLIKSVDGTTTYTQTTWVNWSALKDDSNPMYLWMGDPYTSHYIINMATSLISKA